ncbi:hypothetical protein [Rhizobium sp. CSW-27]|uniref:hypothetical protein n=1 Tax=Rhizobium sp. CSW-27 TaxID=2839985 RepID=UPI001C028030|nr:hypothetical protein [Rhizobium sp. CSW-27]MBT9371859.1 hypothetical protein [Rhizobium sp. CSW-27]
MSRHRSQAYPRIRLRGHVCSAIRLPLAAAVLLLAMGQGPASAQDGAADGGRQDCVVPEQQQNAERPRENGASPSASAQLSDCNGVLKPPAVGDPEMVEPAPPVGDTPVIRPHELPRDQQMPRQGG